jgi:hypothetical protein
MADLSEVTCPKCELKVLRNCGGNCPIPNRDPVATPPAAIPAAPREGEWKCGNEFLPYHPSASHVNPDHRDGWNACYRAALATGAAHVDANFKTFTLTQPTTVQPLKDHEIAKLVNDLRDVAKEFHGHQSLRERIAHLVLPLAKPTTVQQAPFPGDLCLRCYGSGKDPAPKVAAADKLHELQEAHRLGFLRAAGWVQRDDLFADVSSPAYRKDRDHDLAQIKTVQTTALPGGNGEAECEALREDAARFAWLLDNANIDFDPSEPYQLVIWEPGTGDDWKSIVRAAIDAARAAADQGGA